MTEAGRPPPERRKANPDNTRRRECSRTQISESAVSWVFKPAARPPTRDAPACRTHPKPRVPPERVIAHFVRRGLLEREGTERFKVHALGADYSRAQLDDTTRTALHFAHARHYTIVANVADTLYRTKGRATEGLALFDHERAQFEAAYAWLVGCADEAAARLLIDLVSTVAAHTGPLRFHPRQRIAWANSQLRATRF